MKYVRLDVGELVDDLVQPYFIHLFLIVVERQNFTRGVKYVRLDVGVMCLKYLRPK